MKNQQKQPNMTAERLGYGHRVGGVRSLAYIPSLL